eukprot:4564151-Prymnesium_polylepis.2
MRIHVPGWEGLICVPAPRTKPTSCASFASSRASGASRGSRRAAPPTAGRPAAAWSGFPAKRSAKRSGSGSAEAEAKGLDSGEGSSEAAYGFGFGFGCRRGSGWRLGGQFARSWPELLSLSAARSSSARLSSSSFPSKGGAATTSMQCSALAQSAA